MRNKPALSLIELLIVIALISMTGFVFLFSFYSVRAKQALIASTEEMISVLKRAHIYSREEKDGKAWGVRYEAGVVYLLVSGSTASYVAEMEYRMHEPTVVGSGNFEIWFERGSGAADTPNMIILHSPTDQEIEIDVNENGLISYKWL